MFFWCEIELFNSFEYKYGGFNHFIAGKIFKWKYSYISIELRKTWKFNSNSFYYDGTHNSKSIGFIYICYGT